MEKRVPKGRKMWTVQIDENGGVHIPKEALALIGLKAGESAEYRLDSGRRAYLVPAPGVIDVNGVRAQARDGVAVEDEQVLRVTAIEDSEIVLVDLA